MMISRSAFLGRRNIWNEDCRDDEYTCFVFNNFSFLAVSEVMCENIAAPGRPQVTTWRMRIAWWIPQSTNTLSECVILIAFPLQQWLYELSVMLRYTSIACLVSHGLGTVDCFQALMYVYNRIVICRTKGIIWKEVADFCIRRCHNRHRQLIINYANSWFHNSTQFWNPCCFLEKKKATLWDRHALCVCVCVLMS